MTDTTKRGAKEGLGFGLVAGVVFAVAEIIAVAMMGTAPLMPLRMFASIVLGEAALNAVSLGTAIVVGTVVHLALSAVFGLVYGLVNAKFTPKTETSWGRQTWLGLAFGAVLWLVNFQIIARIIYPWFLGTPQIPQLLLHAVFFGLPLSLMYAAAERHFQHVHAPGHV